MDGHLFIAPGSLTELSADAIAFSTNNSLSRSGHMYPAFAAQTTWTVLLPGRKAPPGAPPLVREVAWDLSGDNQRVLNSPPGTEGRKTEPNP